MSMKHHRHSLARHLAPVLFVLVFGAAGKPAAAEEAQRVVSVGGAVTEIVYALGAQDRLVAVDSTSTYPPAADALPDVGYMRQLSAEPILALDPDLLLLVADAGPRSTLDQLRATGLRIVTVPDQPSLPGVLAKVRAVAAALGLQPAGADLAARIEATHQRVAARLADLTTRPRVLFLLSIGRGAPLAAGQETSADQIIALAGGRNALSGFQGYKPLSPEAAMAARPDVILTTERTATQLGGLDSLRNRPELAVSPAAASGRLLALDGLLLLGFGPRTPEAIARLAATFHPELTQAD